MNKPTKSGVILEDIKPEDYLFGKLGDTEVRVPSGDWNPYLPKNEKQRNEFESMCCTNFSSTTAIEILFTWKIDTGRISAENLKWLQDNGYFDDSGHINFSDRFDAIMANTSPDYGNTLKAPADAKHKYGLIPEKMLPWIGDSVKYFAKSSITDEMRSMGLEFLKRFPIGYEMVYPAEYASAIKTSPLASACYAWNGTQNGVYYKVTNQINHAIAVIKQPDIWQIFDSYEPFVKKLANNYLFSGHAIRYLVGEVASAGPSTSKGMLYNLKRDPKKNEEIYAFTQDGLAKRHIVNAETLSEGAKSPDKQWVWDKNIVVYDATQAEWDRAVEIAEILLLPKDSSVIVSNTGDKKSFWAWIKSLFKK